MCFRLQLNKLFRVVVVADIAIGVEGLGFDSWACLVGHSVADGSHHCDVFSKLCCSGGKPWRWALPLVTQLDVIPRV